MSGFVSSVAVDGLPTVGKAFLPLHADNGTA
jgi:hypothetical protein